MEVTLKGIDSLDGKVQAGRRQNIRNQNRKSVIDGLVGGLLVGRKEKGNAGEETCKTAANHVDIVKLHGQRVRW